jgi:hypothetical protein
MSVKATIRDATCAPRVTVVPNPNLKGPSPHYLADVLVSERDGVFSLRLNTKKARDWDMANRPTNAMGLGPALVTEPEHVDDIIAAMKRDGLEIKNEHS